MVCYSVSLFVGGWLPVRLQLLVLCTLSFGVCILFEYASLPSIAAACFSISHLYHYTYKSCVISYRHHLHHYYYYYYYYYCYIQPLSFPSSLAYGQYMYTYPHV